MIRSFSRGRLVPTLALIVALGGSFVSAASHPRTARAVAPRIPHSSGLAIRKDPFISPVDDEAEEAPAQIEPPKPEAPPQQGMPPQGPSAAAAPEPNVHLQGVIVGDHSYAVLDDGGSQRIVSVGDVVGNAKITAISLKGVDLQNGVRLVPSEGNK